MLGKNNLLPSGGGSPHSGCVQDTDRSHSHSSQWCAGLLTGHRCTSRSRVSKSVAHGPLPTTWH
eukprot:14878910-Alexandrium_andersonii.AAC.1